MKGVKKEVILTNFKGNYKQILLPSFLWSLPIIFISLIITNFSSSFLNFIIDEPSVLFSSPLGFIKTYLIMNFIVLLFYALFLYLGMINTSKKIPMPTYGHRAEFCIYIMLFFMVLNILISSIINKQFTFSDIGLLPILITFIIPALYKPKELKN